MKINNVVLSTVIGNEDLIKLAFRDTRMQVPYVVKSIAGLDALDISSNFSGFGENSLAFFDRGLPKRTIIIRLGLNPTFRNARSHSDLRDELYRLISSDRTGRVQVNFCLDNYKIANVEGTIDKVETNHFERSPEAQLTIVCDDGLLRSTTTNVIDVSTFGKTFFVTDCISTAPHGFYMELNMTAINPDFVFKSAYSTFSINAQGGMLEQWYQPNDRLKITTESGKVDARLLRGGLEVSMMEYVQGYKGSQWPVLYPGRNRFEIVSHAEVVRFEYKEAFWGV